MQHAPPIHSAPTATAFPPPVTTHARAHKKKWCWTKLNSGPDRSGREKRDRICLVLQLPAPWALNACHVKISVPDRKPPQIHTVFSVAVVPWRQRRVAAARGGGRRRIPWDERGRARGPKRVLFRPNSRQIPQRRMTPTWSPGAGCVVDAS